MAQAEMVEVRVKARRIPARDKLPARYIAQTANDQYGLDTTEAGAIAKAIQRSKDGLGPDLAWVMLQAGYTSDEVITVAALLNGQDWAVMRFPT